MFMQKDSFLDHKGGQEQDEEEEGDGPPAAVPLAARQAQAVRPVSANTYSNSNSNSSTPSYKDSLGGESYTPPARIKTKPFTPPDLQRRPSTGGDVLSSTFAPQESARSSQLSTFPISATPTGGDMSPAQRLQQQLNRNAEKRMARTLTGGMAVSNDLTPRSRPMSASGNRSGSNTPRSRPGSARPQTPQSPMAFSHLSPASEHAHRTGADPNGALSLREQSRLAAVADARDDVKQLGSEHSAQATEVEQGMLALGIAPVYDPTGGDAFLPLEKPLNGYGAATSALDLSDMRSFLLRPAPRNVRSMLCYIRRDKGKPKLFPKYTLWLNDGDRFLLSARKRKKSKSSNYLISLDEDDMTRQSGNYFGKVRSNFVGTEFTVYDKGCKPSEAATGGPGGALPAPVRCELAAVSYQFNVMGTRGPRRMTAIIPTLDGKGERYTFRSQDDQQGLLEKQRRGEDTDKLVVMRNKPPKWNNELGAYCLNFNGRVTHASVKNFQLVTDDDKDAVILQFGKVGKNAFTMDYRWPMSALQAFSICLTSFDNKLACE